MFDLIIIGAGPAGYTGAIRASQLGLKVAVIEKSKTLGGTCLNVGCIPSKALLESSEHYSFLKEEVEKHGIDVSSIKLNLKKMLQRKASIVTDLTKGISFLFNKNKIKRYQGAASIKSATEVELDSEGKKEILKCKNILIASGSLPIELPFAKFSEDVVSSTEALSFSKVPSHLVVIGGGYIGLELGSVWLRLGSKVTVIEQASSICPGMDKELRDQLYKTLVKQGMVIRLNSRVKQVEKNQVVFVDKDSKETKLQADKTLVCVGRKPCTQGLGLENLGISLNERGQIPVNKNFQTSVPNILAVGDVIEGPMLAHKAEEEGVAVAEYLVNGYGHVNYKTVPSVVYTWPEVASVGLSEEDLKKQNQDYQVGKFPFMANGRARSLGCTEGFVKILADKKTDSLLGVHIIGPRAGDLIAEAVVAMEFEGSSEDLARSFHAHPTLSEAVRESALAVAGRARQI